MGYMHINNLYKAPDFLECYALEKIHGTSAHIRFHNGLVHFFSGGVSHEQFKSLFDEEFLKNKFSEKFTQENDVTFFGEAFGGKCQGMSKTYGDKLRFLVFDVKTDGLWLRVDAAHQLTADFGLGFVPYVRGPMTLEFMDQQRDADSLVAIGPGMIREGVVIRPIREMQMNNGERVIYKHKRSEFMETRTPREVDPEKQKVLEEATAIAEEWVTPNRLEHVLQRVPFTSEKEIGNIIREMQDDIKREAEGEIVWSKQAASAIGKKTASLLTKMPVF